MGEMKQIMKLLKSFIVIGILSVVIIGGFNDDVKATCVVCSFQDEGKCIQNFNGTWNCIINGGPLSTGDPCKHGVTSVCDCPGATCDET